MPKMTKQTQNISDTAVALFKEQGYEAVSVNDICRAANVSRSSFYSAFPNKRAILDYIFAQVAEEHALSLERIMNESNDADRMFTFASRYISIAEDFGPKLMTILLQQELSGEVSIIGHGHDVDEHLIRLTRSAQKSGIFLNPEKPEILGPMGVDIVYFQMIRWAMEDGAFDLRKRSRAKLESLYCLVPELRWPQEEA